MSMETEGPPVMRPPVLITTLIPGMLSAVEPAQLPLPLPRDLVQTEIILTPQSMERTVPRLLPLRAGCAMIPLFTTTAVDHVHYITTESRAVNLETGVQPVMWQIVRIMMPIPVT